MGTKVEVILSVITRCKINKTNGDSFLSKYRQTHSQRVNRLKKKNVNYSCHHDEQIITILR